MMCMLWLELVQVQASFAPAMPLQVGRAAMALPKLLTPVNISQAICFALSTERENKADMQEPSWRCSAQPKSGSLPDMPALGFCLNGVRREGHLKFP